jgi:tripartite-type tricarboxylate transporter receptor subunit TctC
LQTASGRTVIVENVPGAAGNIGIQQVARAPADGSVVLFVPQGNITINATLMPNAPFNWDKDFKPVTLLAYAPNVLVVHPSVPANNVAELLALAKAQPGKLSYGSPGIGSSLHLIGELLKREAKIDLLHVAYKGTTQAMQDLIGGQIQMMFGAVTTLLPAIKAGQVRPLAVTTSKRAEALPDVPTLAEAGVKGIDVPSWYGVMLPAATPDAIVARVHAGLESALSRPAVREKLLAQGLVPVGNKPSDFSAQIKRETATWATVIRGAGIKAE